MKRFVRMILRFAVPGLLMTALFTGCSTSGVVAGDSMDSEKSYIIADDATIASQVSIASVSYDSVGDLMRAIVTLKSNRNRSLWLQYRFSWYDANGVEIDAQATPYRDLEIQGKDGVSVTSIAPSPAAREFKIRVRKIKAFKLENVR